MLILADTNVVNAVLVCVSDNVSLCSRLLSDLWRFINLRSRNLLFAHSLNISIRRAGCRRNREQGRMQLAAVTRPPTVAVVWWQQTTTSTDRSATATTSRSRKVARRVDRRRTIRPRRWTGCVARTRSLNIELLNFRRNFGLSRTCCWHVLADLPLEGRPKDRHHHHHHRLRMLCL